MPRIGLDWARIARYCLLGTIVMLAWLLAPVARCSWGAFRDTPITDEQASSDPANPGQIDKQRVEQGKGFWSKLTDSVGACYARTPLLGQESWKKYALFAFGGATVIAWALGRFMARRQRSYG